MFYDNFQLVNMLVQVFSNLPPANTMIGFIIYSFLAYLFVFIIGSTIGSTSEPISPDYLKIFGKNAEVSDESTSDDSKKEI